MEIAARISHRDLTPIAHRRRTLARRRPHLHCGVCVCVYVCVYICVCVCVTYILSYFYATTSPLPTSSVFHLLSILPDICRFRDLPCYTPTPSSALVHYPSDSPSYPSRSSQDLATPGSEQWHDCSICQFWSLPNARPFFARSAEEQAVGPHYC